MGGGRVKGHQQIVDLRMTGRKPAAVFLNIGPAPTPRYAFEAADRDLAEGALPQVWTESTHPAIADLRCLKGCRVHLALFGGSRDEFWGWWDAVFAAEPAEMFGVEPDGEVVAWPV